MKNILLSRIDFKELVFKRDNYKCVICGKSAVDAHHIIDRSFFIDGGYFINNGVSLCEDHHILAEKTLISCQELRIKANIKNNIYPPHLQLNEFVFDYDKWCNPILKNGKRLKGYYFNQENVQKMLSDVLDLFDNDSERIVEKYPRSYHLPFSENLTNDDRMNHNTTMLLSNKFILTEKLDGECNSMDENYLFSRSRTEPTKNPWCNFLKPKHEQIKNDLKDFNIEICGENLYGIHSICYSKLEDYFFVFGIRNTKHNVWLSFEETKYYAELFDFKTVPVLFESDENKSYTEAELESIIRELMKSPSIFSDPNIFNSEKEGVVCRIENEFPNSMFFNSLSKFVRKSHVRTNQHWVKNWKRALLHKELSAMNIEDVKDYLKYYIDNNIVVI